MRFGKLIVVFIIGLSILTACNKENIPEDMYVHLEEAVSLEEPFAEQQKPLVDLEQQESQLYDEVVQLGLNEFEQVQEKSDEALALVEQRVNILEKEKASIDAAIEEFNKVEPMIENIENEDVKAKAQEMYDVMQERYDAYTNLHDAYATSIEQDKQLYEMFKQEDVEEQALKDQIEEVNKQYDQVTEFNNTFNEKTDQYNQLKVEFYELAELEVEYEETE